MHCDLESEQPLGLIFSSADNSLLSTLPDNPWIWRFFHFRWWKQTISSPVWISRIAPSNRFRWFFLWHSVISSHTCTDQYSGGASRETLSRFPEFFVLHSLFWSFALWTLVYLDTQLHLLNPERPWGSASFTPLDAAFWLSPGSNLGQSQGSRCLFLFFQGLLTSASWCPASENIVSYILTSYSVISDC